MSDRLPECLDLQSWAAQSIHPHLVQRKGLHSKALSSKCAHTQFTARLLRFLLLIII